MRGAEGSACGHAGREAGESANRSKVRNAPERRYAARKAPRNADSLWAT